MILRTLLPVFICSYLLISSQLIAQQEDGWKLTRNQNNIKVYIRQHNETALKEVYARTDIKTSLSAIISVIKDTGNHHKWMYANKISKLLKKNSEFDWILYSESEAPWPVSDRDLISHSKMSQDLKTCTIRIEASGIPDYLPVNEGIVRIQKMHSVWELTPQGNGVVTVGFKILLDLGGNIPTWLVNLAVDKGPYYTLLHFKEIVRQDQYQNAHLSYIVTNCR